MTEIVRDRDVIVIVKGNANPVVIDSLMAQKGWAGGQGVTWTDSPNDEFMVTYSDGTYGGFLLWGSNESADQFISSVGSQQKYNYAILCAGTWVIATRTFEKYTYASRQSGPLVPLTYVVGERLLFSSRGLFTKEDEMTLTNDPRKPNQLFVGAVAQLPINDYMTLQTAI